VLKKRYCAVWIYQVTKLESLNLMKVKDIKSIAKNLSICVTAATKKTELIDRIMAMARIGAIRKQYSDEEDSFSILYLTPKIKEVLRRLPPFSSTTEWSKKLGGVLILLRTYLCI